MKKNANPTTAEEAIKVMTPMVKSLAYKWTRNHYQDYNDLVQEGMMGVMEAWGRYDTTRNNKFSTYAFFWARRRIKDAAQGNWKVFNNSAPEEWGSDATNYGEYDFEAMHVKKELEKMSPEDRQMMIMRAEGYTFSEIQEAVGASHLGKVRNRIIKLTEDMNG